MNRLITAVSALAVACAAPALADTLTWKGGASGSLSAAASWTSDGDHTTPQPGDTLSFATPSAIALSAETFDFGAAGLTVSVAQGVTVTSLVSFGGAGALDKTGAGTLVLNAAGTYAGGTTVSDGQVKLSKSGTALGTGTVTLARGEGRAPNLYIEPNNQVIANPVVITGPYAWRDDITFNNNPHLTGSVTCEGSLRIYNLYGWNQDYARGAPVRCPVTVTDGGTLYVRNTVWLADRSNCPVVASYMHDVNNGICLAKGYVNEAADAVITNAVKGYVRFYEGSRFKGREVVVKGSSVSLVLDAKAPFGDGTAVKVLDGATVQANAITKVPRLLVGGTEVAAGAYTAANFPVSGTLTGDGMLVVGAADGVSTWTGGSLGTWTDEANWDNGVPSDGQVAVFNSGTMITNGTVNIGEGGLTVVCNAKVTVATNATFTGVGKLMKAGAAELLFSNWFALNTYSGGTEILGGILHLDGISKNETRTYAGTSLGSGPVTIRRVAGKESRLDMETFVWLTNTVSVVGPYTASTHPHDFATLVFNNESKQIGKLTADGDVKIGNVWRPAWVGDIDAHGHTVYCYPESKNTPIRFTGAVDASFVKGVASRNWPWQSVVYTDGSFTDPGATYAVFAGTNDVAAAATIACKDVVVSNASAVAEMMVRGNGNLSREAKVSLWNGGRLWTAKGVRCAVAELWADGVKQPIGVYSAAGVPSGATVTAASFTGAGRVRVGDLGGVLIVR